ncbi:hypothetical protein [Candidatus Lokiarchaeum ossiferum]|uniref:hypothetical protein n=1 Tax=Candidatus Lokiarchaeum ossiferum TaxID=2951803 RepID=UPI00352F4824
MSDDKNKPTTEEDAPTKSPLLSAEKAEVAKNVIVKSILWITMLGLFVTVIGGIWAIGDIFSQEKFSNFTELTIQSQLFITGLILLGIFFLVLFLVVLYKRGKKNLIESLFKEAPEKEVKTADEYLPAKIITAGALISFFTIFVGLIVAFLMFLIDATVFTDELGFWSFMRELTGGSIVLIIGLIVLLLDGLIYGMIYIWQNGYYLLINKILRYNQKVEEIHDFSKNERITGKIVFGILVLILVGIVFGIVWTIIESFSSDWGTTFREDYIFGVQLSIIGFFGTLSFGTMISAMFIYKWGNNVIMKALFIQYTPKATTEDNLPAKILAVGILIAIVLLASSLIIWIITLIIDALSSGSGENIFAALAALSGGLALLAYSLITEIFVILILLFIFFLHNGYAFTLLKIMKTESIIDSGLEESKIRAQEKKQQRLKKREEKKTEKKPSKK